MSDELEWELYDIFVSGHFAFPVYEHSSARRIVRYLLMRGVLDEDIASAIEGHTLDLRLWLGRDGKRMVGEWVMAWLNERRDEYKLTRYRRSAPNTADLLRLDGHGGYEGDGRGQHGTKLGLEDSSPVFDIDDFIGDEDDSCSGSFDLDHSESSSPGGSSFQGSSSSLISDTGGRDIVGARRQDFANFYFVDNNQRFTYIYDTGYSSAEAQEISNSCDNMKFNGQSDKTSIAVNNYSMNFDWENSVKSIQQQQTDKICSGSFDKSHLDQCNFEIRVDHTTNQQILIHETSELPQSQNSWTNDQVINDAQSACTNDDVIHDADQSVDNGLSGESSSTVYQSFSSLPCSSCLESTRRSDSLLFDASEPCEGKLDDSSLIGRRDTTETHVVSVVHPASSCQCTVPHYATQPTVPHTVPHYATLPTMPHTVPHYATLRPSVSDKIFAKDNSRDSPTLTANTRLVPHKNTPPLIQVPQQIPPQALSQVPPQVQLQVQHQVPSQVLSKVTPKVPSQTPRPRSASSRVSNFCHIWKIPWFA